MAKKTHGRNRDDEMFDFFDPYAEENKPQDEQEIPSPIEEDAIVYSSSGLGERTETLVLPEDFPAVTVGVEIPEDELGEELVSADTPKKPADEEKEQEAEQPVNESGSPAGDPLDEKAEELKAEDFPNFPEAENKEPEAVIADADELFGEKPEIIEESKPIEAGDVKKAEEKPAKAEPAGTGRQETDVERRMRELYEKVIAGTVLSVKQEEIETVLRENTFADGSPWKAIGEIVQKELRRDPELKELLPEFAQEKGLPIDKDRFLRLDFEVSDRDGLNVYAKVQVSATVTSEIKDRAQRITKGTPDEITRKRAYVFSRDESAEWATVVLRAGLAYNEGKDVAETLKDDNELICNKVDTTGFTVRRDENERSDDRAEGVTRNPNADPEREQLEYAERLASREYAEPKKVNIRFVTNEGVKVRVSKALDTEVYRSGNYREVRFVGADEPIFSEKTLFNAAESAVVPKKYRDIISDKVMDCMKNAVLEVTHRDTGVAIEEIDTRVMAAKWKNKLLNDIFRFGKQTGFTEEYANSLRENNDTMARNVCVLLGLSREVQTYPMTLANAMTKDHKSTPIIEIENVGQRFAAPALKTKFTELGFKTSYDSTNGTFRAWRGEAGDLRGLSWREMGNVDYRDYNSMIYIAANAAAEKEIASLAPEETFERQEIRSRHMQEASKAYVVPDRTENEKTLAVKENSVFAEKFLSALGLERLKSLSRTPLIMSAPVVSKDPLDTDRDAIVVQIPKVNRGLLKTLEPVISERGVRYDYIESAQILTVASCENGAPIFDPKAYREPNYGTLHEEYKKSAAQVEAHIRTSPNVPDEKKAGRVEEHRKDVLSGLKALKKAQLHYINTGMSKNALNQAMKEIEKLGNDVFDDKYRETAGEGNARTDDRTENGHNRPDVRDEKGAR